MSNLAAEKILLAGLVQFPGKLLDYVDYLSDEEFQHSATKITFEAIRSLIIDKEAATITRAKLIAEAKSLGHANYLSITRDGAWIDELFAEKLTEQELDNHFLEVKRQCLKDKYAAAFAEMQDYLSATSDSMSTMIGRVEDTVINQVQVVDKGRNAPSQLSKGLWDFIDDLANDPGQLGLNIGYPVWQERIGQLRNGSLTLVVATAKCGKSQFALRAALNTAKQGFPALLLDSELNKHDQQIRLTAMMAQVPSEYVSTGLWKLSPPQLKTAGIVDDQKIAQIQEYGRRMRDPELRERVNKLPITYQSISGMDVVNVIPHIRRWILKDVKPDLQTKAAQCLVIYDYIKLATLSELRSNGNIAEWQMHGINVSLLHDMMNRYNIPCLAFGQTNNEIDDGIRCVAGGKRISENVTSISYLKKKTFDERAFDGNGTHLFKIFATRYGSGVDDLHINFDADLSHGQFRELGLSTINIQEERQKRLNEFKAKKSDDKQ